jgi:hypothetical protein
MGKSRRVGTSLHHGHCRCITVSTTERGEKGMGGQKSREGYTEPTEGRRQLVSEKFCSEKSLTMANHSIIHSLQLFEKTRQRVIEGAMMSDRGRSCMVVFGLVEYV